MPQKTRTAGPAPYYLRIVRWCFWLAWLSRSSEFVHLPPSGFKNRQQLLPVLPDGEGTIGDVSGERLLAMGNFASDAAVQKATGQELPGFVQPFYDAPLGPSGLWAGNPVQGPSKISGLQHDHGDPHGQCLEHTPMEKNLTLPLVKKDAAASHDLEIISIRKGADNFRVVERTRLISPQDA